VDRAVTNDILGLCDERMECAKALNERRLVAIRSTQ
jgi:hypothetical protein